MSDEERGRAGWTAAERRAIWQLLRMALVLFLAIVIAGVAAALLGSALGAL